jgi:hypothetical protein
LIIDINHFLQRVHYFEIQNSNCKFPSGVKSRLANHLSFWENIGATIFVLDTIKNGYVIPFLENPNGLFKTNNRSAFQSADFVTQACLN